VVCLSSRSVPGLRSAVRAISTDGGEAYSYPCDISRARAAAATAGRIRKERGEVDVIVNCAGITVFKSFLNTSLPEFNAIVSTNLLGQVACIKAVLPSMVRRREGWIFNIISNAAIKTFEGSAAYTATKAGMLGFGRVLREEIKHWGVKVVNIMPGATETAMWSAPSRRKYSRRMMRPSSVAEAVLAAYRMPGDAVLDEIVVRPLLGDIE
jgi:short-subunit dehydrogenase